MPDSSGTSKLFNIKKVHHDIPLLSSKNVFQVYALEMSKSVNSFDQNKFVQPIHAGNRVQVHDLIDVHLSMGIRFIQAQSYYSLWGLAFQDFIDRKGEC